jgi:hypothetical protein
MQKRFQSNAYPDALLEQASPVEPSLLGCLFCSSDDLPIELRQISMGPGVWPLAAYVAAAEVASAFRSVACLYYYGYLVLQDDC